MTGDRGYDALRALALCIIAGSAGCSDVHGPQANGGETHFLASCDSESCGDGLRCVCGVCTIECDATSTCTALADDATCARLEAANLSCGGTGAPESVCDYTCDRSSDCESLGAGFECTEARCRAAENDGSVDEDDAAVANDAGPPGCSGDGCNDEAGPLIFLLVDTSGSLERLAGCPCTSVACTECLPDCSSNPQRNRWTQILEALTGSFEDFSCTTRDRAEFGTYDAVYGYAYNEPHGTQSADGILDMYADRIRFGVATLDSIDAYGTTGPLIAVDEFDFAQSSSESGLWSYPELTTFQMRPDDSLVGVVRYPEGGGPYLLDTGIRNANATQGGLLVAFDPSSTIERAQQMQASLLETRPYGGSPIAAALDDLYWYFANDPAAVADRAAGHRERHVVVIADGRPDDDYRGIGCDCGEEGSDIECSMGSSADFVCPYPKAEDAARILRCGYSEDCTQGVVDAVHVLSFDAEPDDLPFLDALAVGGGTTDAQRVSGSQDIRDFLVPLINRLLDPIATTPPADSCTVGSVVYAPGAIWWEGCNRCTCGGGCTEIACKPCTSDDDCDGDDVCQLGAACDIDGRCRPSEVPESCDAPLDTEQLCGCDGQTYQADDCAVLLHGIDYEGACDDGE